MKTLEEIESEYIRDVILFFCREYTSIFLLHSFINFKISIENISNRVSKQINDRLLTKNLISDYKVQVNIHPKDEKRDSIIDNILEDKSILEDNIIVYYQRRRGDKINEIKYKI